MSHVHCPDVQQLQVFSINKKTEPSCCWVLTISCCFCPEISIIFELIVENKRQAAAAVHTNTKYRRVVNIQHSRRRRRKSCRHTREEGKYIPTKPLITPSKVETANMCMSLVKQPFHFCIPK